MKALRIGLLESAVALSLFTATFRATLSDTDGIRALSQFLLVVGVITAIVAVAAAAARGGTGTLGLLVAAVFLWLFFQAFRQAGGMTAGYIYLPAVALAWAAPGCDLKRLVVVTTRVFTVGLFGLLFPIALPGTWESGRSLLPGLNARFFGVSNPDALGYYAGIVLLLAICCPRSWASLAGVLGAALMFLATDARGSLIATALGCAVIAACRKWGLGRPVAAVAAVASIGATASLAVLPTYAAVQALGWLGDHVSLSHRTLIWYRLVLQADWSSVFWSGIGDTELGELTYRIYTVYSAHSAFLQLAISKGFVSAALVLSAIGAAAVRVGWKLRAGDSIGALGLGLVASWYVTGLTSAETVLPVGILLPLVFLVGRAAPRTDESLDQIPKELPSLVAASKVRLERQD